jgi:hypothetical protein
MAAGVGVGVARCRDRFSVVFAWYIVRWRMEWHARWVRKEAVIEQEVPEADTVINPNKQALNLGVVTADESIRHSLAHFFKTKSRIK